MHHYDPEIGLIYLNNFQQNVLKRLSMIIISFFINSK